MGKKESPFFEKIKKIFPNCVVSEQGKKVEQMYKVLVKADDEKYDNIYYVKESSFFNNDGEECFIPKIEIIGINNRFITPLINKEIYKFKEEQSKND